ncbi:Uncharacterized protein PPKH_3202 [Pseudomonas putida]|nr:Uncharacterized protein PPKH_3202 [Pseudomonas putida]
MVESMSAGAMPESNAFEIRRLAHKAGVYLLRRVPNCWVAVARATVAPATA